MDPRPRLAVDLGTCHTIAVIRRGDENPRPVLFDGSPLLASGVYAAPGSEVLVGRDAERMAQAEPSRFEPFPKRRIDEGAVLLGDRELPVTELLAAVLRRVATEAGQAGANPAGATVLTCPADWGSRRRSVLLEAARVAGLGSVALVDEPIAAARYCQATGHQTVPIGQYLAVFDFGGGTLDITVIRQEPSGPAVLAVGGLDDLGGVDFDAALVGHLGQLIAMRDPETWRRLDQPARPSEWRDRRTFWSEIRAAKEMLSRASNAPVHVPGWEDAVHLTREELERVVGPLVDRAVDETRRVLQRAGVRVRGRDDDSGVGPGGGPGPGQLAGIFLVGGSSRIPLVASRLHARFLIAPSVPEQPELPVAFGALLGFGPGTGATGAGAAVPVSAGPVSPGPLSAMSGSPMPGSPMPGSPISASPVSPMPGSAGPMPMPVSAGPVSPGPGSPVPVWPGPLGPPGAPLGPPAAPLGPPAAPQPWPGTAPGQPARSLTPAPRTSRLIGGRRARISATGLVVLALVIGLNFGGKALFDTLGKATGDLSTFGKGSGKTLTAAVNTEVPGDQAVAVALGTDTVYTAAVGADKTDVTATPVAGGTAKWTVTVAMEPADLRLTVVGDLVILDGDRADTHNDQDVRAVLDAKTGVQRWLAPWADRLDIAYLGTDALVQQRVSTETNLSRVDLLTGQTKWRHANVDDMYLNDDRLSQPVLAWPGGGAAIPAGGVAAAAKDRESFHQPLALDPTIAVQLAESDERGETMNAADGKARASGALPLDAEQWTVFDNLIVGQLSDQTNRVAAFGVADFAKKWEYQLPAGSTVDRIAPCWQGTLCLAGSGASGAALVALDSTTGRERWKHQLKDLVDTSLTDPDWILVDGRIVVGDGTFRQFRAPTALDPTTGEVKRRIGGELNALTAVASSGSRLALSDAGASAAGGVTWRIVVESPSSGKRLGSAEVGADQPAALAMSDSTLAVLTKDRKLKVFPLS